jgi:hypothetical protein
MDTPKWLVILVFGIAVLALGYGAVVIHGIDTARVESDAISKPKYPGPKMPTSAIVLTWMMILEGVGFLVIIWLKLGLWLFSGARNETSTWLFSGVQKVKTHPSRRSSAVPVDTGSTDGTVEVATKPGCEVVHSSGVEFVRSISKAEAEETSKRSVVDGESPSVSPGEPSSSSWTVPGWSFSCTRETSRPHDH